MKTKRVGDKVKSNTHRLIIETGADPNLHAVSLQMTYKPGCHHFPPGQQLLSQP